MNINEDFFDAAFKGRLSDNKSFKPITAERSLEIINESLEFHEKIYLPAEKEAEKLKGSPLNFGEMMSLSIKLKYESDGQ